MNALEIKNLTKTFKDFKLSNINLTLPSGCILGLVGENGAGKSTTVKLILDMLRADSGSITVLGRDSRRDSLYIKENVGVVFDDIGISTRLSAAEVGKVMKNIYSNWDSSEYMRLIDKFSLPMNKPFKDFSRGMKMKLGIAIAMSHRARLLLLDEATSGLDPVMRDEIVSMLNDYTRDETHSVLISSHIVSDLEKLCDYIAFIHKGEILLCEEKDILLSEYGIMRGSESEINNMSDINPDAVLHKKITPYGAEAIVKKNCLPAGARLGAVGIEELFVFMIKGENVK